MKQKKTTIVYPNMLRKELEKISTAPMSVLLAESGFGKTTILSDFLNSHFSKEVFIRWYTCFGESSERAWAGICRLFALVDPVTAGHLGEIDLPEIDLLGYVAEWIGGITCHDETYLIIDNYHMARFPSPYRLLEALSRHCCPELHIIVLTQPVYHEEYPCVDSGGIYTIRQQAFCFQADDVRDVFLNENIRISNSQARQIIEKFGGGVDCCNTALFGLLSARRRIVRLQSAGTV